MTDEEKPKVAVLPKVKDSIPINELPPRVRLGRIIRRKRTKLKLSLAEVAAKTIYGEGVDESSAKVVLGQIERGIRPATQEQVEALAETLGIDRDDLMRAAQDWTRDVWETQAVDLEPTDVRIASLAPSRAQLAMTRDEVERLCVNIDTAVNDLADIQARLKANRARAQAMLDDLYGALPIEKPEDIPELDLGCGPFNPHPCERCGGTGKDPDVEEVEGIKLWELRCSQCNGTGQDIPMFEEGHVYAHTTGHLLRVVGSARTTGYGKTLVAEHSDRTDLMAVGSDKASTANYREVPLSAWYTHWLRANPNDPELERLRDEALAKEAGDGVDGQDS